MPARSQALPRRLLLGAALLALGGGGLLLVRSRPPPAPPACRPTPVAPEALQAHVRQLSEALVPRDVAHPAGLERAAQWVEGQLQATGAPVTSERFLAAGVPVRNLVASFGPDTPERLVVGAHYDTDGALPGADDNASGVAGLLALARAFAARPPPLRVDLVAFTTEEVPHFGGPHMGSAVHARALRRAGVRVRAMLALEMLGFYSEAPGSQRYPLEALSALYPDTGHFLAVVGRQGEEALVERVAGAMAAATALPVEHLSAPRGLEGVELSDHASFWEEGFPAVMVTDTAFFRNPHYHTAQDTWDTLDYGRMAQAVQAVECAVRVLAAAPP